MAHLASSSDELSPLKHELTENIKSKALNLGFNKIGIAHAQAFTDDADHLNNWLGKSCHADMQWMAKRAPERNDVFKYFPEAKSIIVVGLNYFTGNASEDPNIGKISNYAWGDDYHQIIQSRLFELLKLIQSENPDVKARVCVDTSPVLEKAWAQKAGLGWIGKNTCLITKKFGSWLFLGELIVDIELEYDAPFQHNYCGTCTACVDACPTDALVEPNVLDTKKCISYLTIEKRGDIDHNLTEKFNGWIYGCDICQQVCPWNIKSAKPTSEQVFQPRADVNKRKISDWEKLTAEEFQILFKKSPIKRTKYSGLHRNIKIALKKLDHI